MPSEEAEFDVIYADPPWSYREGDAISFRGCRKAPANKHYETMSLRELCAMRPFIDRIAADPCALFLWGTWPKLRECLDLGQTWGFIYVTCAFVWVKLNPQENADQGHLFEPDWDARTFCGLGFYARGNTEFVLFFRRGKPELWKDRGIRQLVFAPRREHSRKPDEVRKRIERAYPEARRIELFARETMPGWVTHGKERFKFNR